MYKNGTCCKNIINPSAVHCQAMVGRWSMQYMEILIEDFIF